MKTTTVGQLTLADIGKTVAVGSADVGVVTGRLGQLNAYTDWVDDYTYGDVEPTRHEGRTTYGIGVGYWYATDIPASMPVVIRD